MCENKEKVIMNINKEGMKMATIMRRLFSGMGVYSGSDTFERLRLRGSPPILLFIALLFSCALAIPAYAADSNTEFEAVDDMTISGTEGKKNDADLEVKGVSSFSKDIFIEAGILASPYGGIGQYENLLK